MSSKRCGFQIRLRDEKSGRRDKCVLLLGDDFERVPLEVLAAENVEEEFTVIHAMNLRARCLGLYEEARNWRR